MGGAGFAVIKYDRVVFQAVHSHSELGMEQVQNNAKIWASTIGAISPRQKQYALRRHSFDRLQQAQAGQMGRDTFYKSSIQKYFRLCNHAAWWTLAIAGFSMSLGREEAVFFGILWRFFPPITVLSRGALCEEYFQWRLICGAKRHWQSCKSQHFEDVSHRQ